ncbi:MAG TPA: LuxR C-terminal-related transcriptional regulator [Gammaproteobacteria bacterium]|nr:LuxR C-terminal-related transcriptional regulator [Gammaproteobacteria bacterium]
MNQFDLNDDFELTSNILSAVPGYIVWKDVGSKIICANQFAINRLGFQNFQQIYGKTPVNLNCRFAEIGESLMASDQFTMQHDKQINIVVSAFMFGPQWGFYLGQQQPLKNKDNQIIGTSVHCVEMTGSSVVDQFSQLFIAEQKRGVPKINQGIFRSLENSTGWNLSPRQEECLFWLLRGKSAKEIADLLGISKRTSEHYIESIKEKSGVRSKSELIDIALGKGFASNLPKHWYKFPIG